MSDNSLVLSLIGYDVHFLIKQRQPLFSTKFSKSGILNFQTFHEIYAKLSQLK